MRISVLTIFPEMFDDFLREPVISRAIRHEIVSIDIVDIRKFAGGSFRHLDDDTYGGGAGMVMRAVPILKALQSVQEDVAQKTDSSEAAVSSPCSSDSGGPRERGYVCVMTPSGRLYNQETARAFARKEHLILICGHYEGIDERVMKHADAEISIGDYVLTGGELPAKVVMDSVIRLLDGVLRKESTEEESFQMGLLEYPQYTKPFTVEGEAVPEDLLSGDHGRIRKWRLRQSLLRTLHRRPDLLLKRGLTEEERGILEAEELTEEERGLLAEIRVKSSARRSCHQNGI